MKKEPETENGHLSDCALLAPGSLLSIPDRTPSLTAKDSPGDHRTSFAYPPRSLLLQAYARTKADLSDSCPVGCLVFDRPP